MVFGAGLDLVPELGMVPTPALIAYAKLLARPGAELEQTVAGELAQNPALIQDEARACGACGMPADPPCPYCSTGTGGPGASRNPAGPSPGPGPVARVAWAETCSGRPARPREIVRSDTGRALGGILSDSLRSAARQALPVVGQAIGDIAGGSGDLGARAGSAVGTLLGLELEGLSAEDREFEVARQLVRFAGSAVGQAAAAPPRMPPSVVAQTAASRAARVYAPGLLPRLQGRSTKSWPRCGRWIRRGRTIVLYGS